MPNDRTATITIHPNPVFAGEIYYSAKVFEPDGREVNSRSCLDTASEALEFVLGYGIKIKNVSKRDLTKTTKEVK